MMPTGKASGNAVLAKARALYGSRLRADDYRRLMACRTMTELAAALKEYPLYSEALGEVNPQYARRVQLENLLRQSLYTRYDSLCRYDRSAGSKVYEYFTLCCEVDELTAAMRCLDAGRPGDYLFRLPEFLQQRCCIDLYALAKATSLDGILAAVAGTRWEKVLAPLQSAKPDRGLTAQAEPLLAAGLRLFPGLAGPPVAYAAGVLAGGVDDGEPGPRPHYGDGYYGAYLRDPDGNKVHIVHRGDM